MVLAKWRHVFLYAKNRYQRRDVVKDVRHVVALELDCLNVTNEVLLLTLFDIAKPFLMTARTIERLQRLFLTSAKRGLELEDVVRFFLGILCDVRIETCEGRRLLNLGEPDSGILPVR